MRNSSFGRFGQGQVSCSSLVPANMNQCTVMAFSSGPEPPPHPLITHADKPLLPVQFAHEFVPVAEVSKIPKRVRGLYVLYRSVGRRSMKVVYIGMARGEQSGVKGRLRQHQRNKAEEWTHVSVYEVWDNIPAQQVEEA